MRAVNCPENCFDLIIISLTEVHSVEMKKSTEDPFR